MRIGVDAHRLSLQRFGIGRYIEYLLKHMGPLLESHERMLIYVRDAQHAESLELSDRFEIKALPSRLDGVWWENLVLARQSHELDVLFGPSYTIPLTFRGKTVVATHSVNEAEPGAHDWRYRLTYSQRNRLCARKADAVIVPVESVRKHVIELYGVAPDMIEIVPEGVDDAFQPVEDEEVLRRTRIKYLGEDKPYLLFVGKQSMRRSTPALIDAFARLKHANGLPHKLLLYGKNVENLPLTQLAEDLGVGDDVVQINEVLDNHLDILPVYSAADVYVFPSAYEGFSLTTCEAMACGLPVVTVKRGAVAEIVGDAAVTVDRPTPDELALAIKRVLSDDSLRKQLGERSLERIKLFRWSETARGTLDVIRRVGMS